MNNSPENQTKTDGCGSLPLATGSPPWVSVNAVLAILNDPRWSWYRNSPCKYVELRIDTRTMDCLISNRDGHRITLKDLSRQLDEYLLANAASEPHALKH